MVMTINYFHTKSLVAQLLIICETDWIIAFFVFVEMY